MTDIQKKLYHKFNKDKQDTKFNNQQQQQQE